MFGLDCIISHLCASVAVSPPVSVAARFVPHYDVHVFNLHLRGFGSCLGFLPPQPYLNLNPAAFPGEQVFFMMANYNKGPD